MSLSSLQGKTVVLEFTDPHCVDICPIVSQEFVDAYHDLGTPCSGVVFAAGNGNRARRAKHELVAEHGASYTLVAPTPPALRRHSHAGSVKLTECEIPPGG